MRASDASWQGGLLLWLQRLERDSEGRGGALLVLDNAEQLLTAAGDGQPGGSSPSDAQVRHTRCYCHRGHSCMPCRVGDLLSALIVPCDAA